MSANEVRKADGYREALFVPLIQQYALDILRPNFVEKMLEVQFLILRLVVSQVDVGLKKLS